MNLELNADEAEILREVVAQSVREIGPEIHHTRSRQYRDQLEQRRETLGRLLERLEGATAHAVATGGRSGQ